MVKGKVENTIPERQFENIRTTYYFENEDERHEAIERSIQDCIEYSGVVGKLILDASEKEKIISGIKWKKNQRGRWVYEPKKEDAL